MHHKTINNTTFFYKGELSQWFGGFKNQNSSFYYDGIKYNCAEQWMMARKAIIFNDRASYQKIMITQSPKEHQALGRKVSGYNQEAWDKIKERVVFMGNLLKFSQNPHLYIILMRDCGDKFVESSPIDKVWGIGIRMEDIQEKHCDPKTWKGQNLLGESITKVKQSLTCKNQ